MQGGIKVFHLVIWIVKQGTYVGFTPNAGKWSPYASDGLRGNLWNWKSLKSSEISYIERALIYDTLIKTDVIKWGGG